MPFFFFFFFFIFFFGFVIGIKNLVLLIY
jgi:hypothetical protein